MNPFEQPPSSSPVSMPPPVDAPGSPSGSGGRRRTALVALAAAGLVGGGLVGLGQLVSAERPEIQSAASAPTPSVPDDDTNGDDTNVDDTGGDETGGDDTSGERPTFDGEIVVDTGDGDPIVIDLGDGTVDGEPLGDIAACLGVPFDLGDLGDLGDRPFGDLPFGDLPFGDLPFGSDGAHVTVVGPDGVSVVDLGEGDGSVTITQQDGQITVTSTGDATVSDLSDLPNPFEDFSFEDFSLHDLPFGDLPFGDLEELERMLDDELAGNLPAFDEMFEPLDRAEIERCLGGIGAG